MAKLGVVTVLYQCNDVLEDFFKSISLQSFNDYHLYLIDNSPSAETDNLIVYLVEKYSIAAFTHLKNPENYGVAKGNNQGIELALGNNAEYIILSNNDIDFHQDYLFEQMVNCAVQKGEDMIIPKIFYHGTNKIWMAGGIFINYKGTSATIGDKEPDGEKFNQEKHFNYAPTCFMLITKKVFDTIGLMDEKYFVYYDDNDFVYRAIKKQFKIYFLPKLEVFHKVSFSTGGAESLFSIYYLNRNRIYFIRKNFSFPLKQIALAHTIITKSIRYLMYNSDRKKQLFKSIKDGFSMPVN